MLEVIKTIGEAILGTFCQMGEVACYLGFTAIICSLIYALGPFKGIKDLFGGL